MKESKNKLIQKKIFAIFMRREIYNRVWSIYSVLRALSDWQDTPAMKFISRHYTYHSTSNLIMSSNMVVP